jgi:hypothetical protein
MECKKILLPEDFDETQFAEIAEHNGLIWRQELPATNERLPQSIYSHLHLKIEVYFIFDEYRRLVYLDCCGEGLDNYLEQLKQKIPWISPEKVLSDASQTDDLDLLALSIYRLDIIKDYIETEQVMDSLRFGIKSDDLGVIDAVVTTISHFGLPIMRPILAGLIDHEDEQVHEEAKYLLELFDEMVPKA